MLQEHLKQKEVNLEGGGVEIGKHFKPSEGLEVKDFTVIETPPFCL